MNFALAFLIYFIIFLILLYAFSKSGMRLFSALAVTSLISAIFLVLLIPPSDIEEQIDIYFSYKKHKYAKDFMVLLYILIMTLSLLLISAYVIFKAYEDKEIELQL